MRIWKGLLQLADMICLPLGAGRTLEQGMHPVLGVEGQHLLGAIDILEPFRSVLDREPELGQN